jgi:hypothetical protein
VILVVLRTRPVENPPLPEDWLAASLAPSTVSSERKLLLDAAAAAVHLDGANIM